MTRDESGRFVKGTTGNPRGRMPKDREEKYYAILMQTCTFADWEAITKKAIDQAKKGDVQARKWLSDYLIGPPIERKEITGANGGPLSIKLDWGDHADNDSNNA